MRVGPIFWAILLAGSLQVTLSSPTAAQHVRVEIPAIAIPIVASVLAIPIVILGAISGAKALRRRSRGKADIYRVWYATNRQKFVRPGYVTDDGAVLEDMVDFGDEISTEMSYGTCDVYVPKGHKTGSVGSGPIKRAFQRVTRGEDDRLKIVKVCDLSVDGLLTSMKAESASRGKELLVYIHGYANSFDSAIVRAAQIGFDLNVAGVTVAFCWASRGELLGYTADIENARFSEKQLADFLVCLAQRFPDHRINIIAHSMGNRAFLGAVEKLLSDSDMAGFKFGQIFLAAPDLDARLFKTVAEVYCRLSLRTTMYACSRDTALWLSHTMNKNPRAGYCPPVLIVKGIDTIEATNVALDRLGHGYYAESSAVLYDMASLLRRDQPPNERMGIVELFDPEQKDRYWAIRGVNH